MPAISAGRRAGKKSSTNLASVLSDAAKDPGGESTSSTPVLQPEVGRHLLSAFLLACLIAVVVGRTGGYSSSLKDLFLLPVLYVAVWAGLRSGLVAAGVVCLFFVALTPFSGPLPSPAAPIQAAVLLTLAASVGLFAEGTVRAVRAANARAKLTAQRAEEMEWLTDTVVMMESLRNLEQMFSVALLRVADRCRVCDTAAVFLCQGEDKTFNLIQTMGLQPRNVWPRTLNPSDPLIPQRGSFEVRLWQDGRDSLSALGAFAELDPAVKSVLIIPLRTLDDPFGILILASHQSDTFTLRERDLFTRLARHMVYPIQRLRLQTMATTDPLTGLNNRRAFWQHLADETERSRRYRRPLSLLLLDIDHFKNVNDTSGHPAGDVVLSHIGALLHRVIRTTDFAARYGGEEMAVLCPETSPDDALILAERIRVAVENCVITLPSSEAICVTVSLGVAAVPAHADDGPSLVEAADEALYRAKRAGRNRVLLADSGPSLADVSPPPVAERIPA